MSDKEYISNWQMATIVIGFLLGTSIIFTFELGYAQRDTWIAEIIGALVGLVIILCISSIIKKFPKKDAGEIFDLLFGPYLGRIFMVSIVGFAIMLGALVLNNIQSLMNTMVMSDTPPWTFIVTMSLATGFIVSKGIEVMARVIELSMPIVLFLLITLSLFTATLIKPENYLPLFRSGLVDIFKASLLVASFPYAECVLLLFAATSIKDSKSVAKGSLLGFLVGSVLLFSRPIFLTGVFGVEQAAKQEFPMYSMIRQINIGQFLERVELTILSAWFFTTFVKLAVSIFATAKGLAYIFKVTEYNRLCLPIAMLMIPLSVKAYDNYQETQEFISTSWPILVIPTFLILLIVYVFALFHKTKSS